MTTQKSGRRILEIRILENKKRPGTRSVGSNKKKWALTPRLSFLDELNMSKSKYPYKKMYFFISSSSNTLKNTSFIKKLRLKMWRSFHTWVQWRIYWGMLELSNPPPPQGGVECPETLSFKHVNNIIIIGLFCK